jgi:nitroreductase
VAIKRDPVTVFRIQIVDYVTFCDIEEANTAMIDPTPGQSTDDAADHLRFLDARQSTPSRLLGAPGPNDRQLQQMLRSAVRVPDHGTLTPWRVLMIRGDARARLGELLAARQRERDPAAKEAVVEKDRQRFNHAPLILTVVSRIECTDRIPAQEQLLSGGCVCFALLQAAQALGFGAQWLTGWAAYDPQIMARLGLRRDEQILGFIHVGTPQCDAAGRPDRPRPDPAVLLSEWHG